MKSFEDFKSKYGPLITDPYASCAEDKHWESIYRAKVAASMQTLEPFLTVWATDKVKNKWIIRPLKTPNEFDDNPNETEFWVTTKPRIAECNEEYLWIQSNSMDSPGDTLSEYIDYVLENPEHPEYNKIRRKGGNNEIY